ncbi:hypothetical protein [Natronorubrum sp. FCH18a]|uniref:hypothetical protein n=1 Tax=Natronorubrum sp. FCH18a TaxID=3447018 RepID=UPI003F510F54
MKLRSGRSITAVTCPDCSAHLEDTWTGDECGRCGFQYILERSEYRQSIKPGPSLSTATIALLLAFLGGGALAESGVKVADYELVQSIDLLIAILSSGSALFAIGLLALSLIVLLASSINRSPAVSGGKLR